MAIAPPPDSVWRTQVDRVVRYLTAAHGAPVPRYAVDAVRDAFLGQAAVPRRPEDPDRLLLRLSRREAAGLPRLDGPTTSAPHRRLRDRIAGQPVQSPCDFLPALLTAELEQDVSAIVRRNIADHLVSCGSCAQFSERLSAAERTWEQAGAAERDDIDGTDEEDPDSLDAWLPGDGVGAPAPGPLEPEETAHPWVPSATVKHGDTGQAAARGERPEAAGASEAEEVPASSQGPEVYAESAEAKADAGADEEPEAEDDEKATWPVPEGARPQRDTWVPADVAARAAAAHSNPHVQASVTPRLTGVRRRRITRGRVTLLVLLLVLVAMAAAAIVLSRSSHAQPTRPATAPRAQRLVPTALETTALARRRAALERRASRRRRASRQPIETRLREQSPAAVVVPSGGPQPRINSSTPNAGTAPTPRRVAPKHRHVAPKPVPLAPASSETTSPTVTSTTPAPSTGTVTTPTTTTPPPTPGGQTGPVPTGP